MRLPWPKRRRTTFWEESEGRRGSESVCPHVRRGREGLRERHGEIRRAVRRGRVVPSFGARAHGPAGLPLRERRVLDLAELDIACVPRLPHGRGDGVGLRRPALHEKLLFLLQRQPAALRPFPQPRARHRARARAGPRRRGGIPLPGHHGGGESLCCTKTG